MNNDELQKIINVRMTIINAYNRLDGGNTPGTSVVKQIDVARMYEYIVKELDGVLQNHVSIGK